jgi:hypothetical protein
MRRFWSCHGASTKQRVVELLTATMQEVLAALAEAPAVPPGGAGSAASPEHRAAAVRRAAFKGVAYLYVTAVQVADKTSSPAAGALASGGGSGAAKKGGKGAKKSGGGKKAGGKKGRAADDEDDEDDGGDGDGEGHDGGEGGASEDPFDWASLREPCIRLLVDVLGADMRKVFPMGVVDDEEFLSSFSRTGVRLLSSAPSMKDKEARAATVRLLATACFRFPALITSTVPALVDAVTKHEHATACVADVVEAWAGASSSTPAPHAVADLLRELGRLHASSSSSSSSGAGGASSSGAAAPAKDAAGVRRAAALIMDVSSRCPALVLANVSVLLPYLDCDSHTLRSALVTTLGNIVAQSFNTATAAAAGEAFSASTRDALLDVLVERAHDVHAFTRAAVLRSWITLAQATAIPLDRVPAATALAVDRLRDKGALVRRTAVQFLRSLLENNPFGPRVDPAVFAGQVAVAEAWLAANAPAVWAQLTGAPMPAAAKPAAGADDADDEEGAAADEALLADSAQAMANEAAGGSGGAEETVDVVVSPEAARYVQARSHFSQAVTYAQTIVDAIPTLAELLASKTGSDVMEAIRFLAAARAFGVPGAEAGLAKMLMLVWAEGPVREEVVSTFDTLYILNEALDEADGEAWAAAGGGAQEEVGAEDGAPAPKSGAAAAAAAADGEDDDADEEEEEDAAAAAPRRSGRASKARVSLKEDDGEDDEDDDGEDDDEDDDDDEGGPKKGKKKAPAAKKKPAAAKAKKAAAAKKPAAAGGASKGKKKSSAASAAARASVDPHVVADGLVRLLNGASLAVRTSLEEVVRLCTQRGLLPASVFGALWEMVAYGVASLARTRISVATHIATAASGSSPAAQLADAADALRGQVGATDAVLQRARAAMCVLGMAAAASADTVDSPAGLARLYAILHPIPIAGVPVGAALLRAAAAFLGPSSDGHIALVDPALCLGDYRLARHACSALQRFAGSSLVGGTASKDAATAAAAAAAAAPTAKAPTAKAAAALAAAEKEKEAAAAKRAEMLTHLLSAVAAMVRGDWDGGDVETPHWYAAAQQGIDALFALAPQPGAICTDILRSMAEAALLVVPASGGGDKDAGADAPTVFSPAISRTRLSRLFFVLGHVSMKLFIHVESLAARVKLVRIRASERAEHAGKGGSSSSSAAAAKGGAATAAAGKNSAANDGIEEQLGVGAAEDEKEADLVVQIAERELAAANLGGLFSPLLSATASTLLAHGGDAPADSITLAQSALLALCKLMAVSADFCERSLQLLFTVLANARSPRVRGVIAIALGDLAFRFPNLIEPYTPHLYARLRDGDSGVRKNTLMVLTHLILNDMVKVKGQVGEIAICLNDPEPRIADLTRLFFNELAKRGNNPIYNILPDTLSCLSKLANEPAGGAGAAGGEKEGTAAGPGAAAGPGGLLAPSSSSAVGVTTVQPLDAETFRDVVRFLLGFINKDKQSESLAEKLLHRLETSEDRGLWRDVAYCVAQLPMTDKVLKKLSDASKGYKRCLADPDVWESFAFMLGRAKKLAGSKGELKALVDEWEAALNEGRSGAAEDDEALEKARVAARRARRIAQSEGIDASAITAQAMAAAAASVSAAAAEAEAAAKAAGGRKGAAGKKKAAAAGAGAAAAAAAAAPAPAAAAAGKAKPKRKGIIEDSDDEEEQEEEDEADEEEAEEVRPKGRGKAAAATAKAPAAAKAAAAPVPPPAKGKAAGAAAAPLASAASKSANAVPAPAAAAGKTAGTASSSSRAGSASGRK